MTASEILAELRTRGVRIETRPRGGVWLGPAHLIDPGLRDRIRRHKAELIALLSAHAFRPIDDALALLRRLRTFTLPAGRIPAAVAIVERLRPLLDAATLDPAAALTTLQSTEKELIALGAAPDLAVAEAVGLVTAAFPDARLVYVRKLQ